MKQSALLKRMLAAKRGETARAARALPLAQLKEILAKAPPTRNFRESITRTRAYEIHLIAEMKKASPVKGVLRPKMDVSALGREFEAAGASAMSVLTDSAFFQGSKESPRIAKQASSLPVLWKDFIVDEYQVYEARLHGADAILLITRLLAQKKLKYFISLARNLSLDALVEVHTAAEVKRAVDAGAEIIGINNRDLDSFKVDFARARELRPRVPPGRITVCESGVDSSEQIHALRELKFDAVLVGESLMRSRNPANLIHELLHT